MTKTDTRDRQLNRRQFFQRGVWAVGGAFSLLLGIPLIGYFISPWWKEAPELWVQVCTLDQINSVEPVEFSVTFKRTDMPQPYDDVRGVFVIRQDAEILAFSNVCTHMGCAVRWLAWRQQILCPCHGGMYDRYGVLAGGPPSHSLRLYVSKVQNNALFIANRVIERV